MNKIRVIYVVNDAVMYGANVALLNLIDEIKDSVESYVIVGENGGLCDELTKRNIPFSVIKQWYSIYPNINSVKDVITFIPRIVSHIFTNIRAVKKIRNIIRELNSHIVHTNIGPCRIGYRAATKEKIPHVWHIREYQDLDFNLKPFPSMKNYKHTITNGKSRLISITEGIFNYFSMGSLGTVIYDGVLSKKDVKYCPTKEEYFLFAGRLQDAKGIKELISAFIIFAQENDTFLLKIAGTGKDGYVDALKKELQQNNLLDRVEFLGFIENIFPLMQKATALIVPSRNEGFGFITVEAMFNGCLVIGNNTAGTKEIIGENGYGILYFGVSNLIEQMIDIAKNGLLNYINIIELAQKQAVDMYSIEKHSRSIYHLYLDILNS